MTTSPPLATRTSAVRLRALLVAHLLSRTGNVVTTVAVPFAVLANGGTATDVGMTAFAATVPIVLGGPFGGALIERVGVVRSSVLADVVSGTTLVAMPLLTWTVGLPFWAILALVACSGALDAPGDSARRVLLPDLADAVGVPLERAVGNFEAVTRLSTLLGAPLGGLVVGTFGSMPALVVTAGAFAGAAAVMGLLARSTSPSSRTTADDTDGAVPRGSGYWRDIVDGFRFTVRDPLFRLVVALVVITNLLDAGRMSTLMPLYADRALGGPEALGWMTGTFGGSAFIGALLFARVAHRMPRRIPFVVCFVLAGGPSLVAPALGATLPWMIATLALSGFAAGAVNPIMAAVQLERVPEHLRTRVFGLLSAASWTGVPVGGLLAGVTADGIGIDAGFAVVALLYTLTTLAPLTGGSWRLMEKARSQPQDEASSRDA